ncbi:MAG: BamA/TamA family outer membrane protein [Muribaculaceae bacterium]|nr:BamA/TamA family outer membrane protein [Muribaculaceae bacterium]
MGKTLTTITPFRTALTALLIFVLAACSTTSKLGEKDVLYTGVKKLKYNVADSVDVASEMKDQIFDVINVKPNNPLYSPYYRTPFPVGLWVYNHMDPNAKGFKGWLYKKLVARPVLISRVKPDTRVEMIDELLRNNGYFHSAASYELNYSKSNPKKASITYEVNVSKPHVLGNIEYTGLDTPVGHIIDSVAQKQYYLRAGSRYCTDSLNEVRINITNRLRNQGYYYFRPEYIEYIADSITKPGTINLRLVMASNVPNTAYEHYLARDITVMVSGEHSTAQADTVELRNCTLIKMQPVHISDRVIESNIRGRRGRPFRVGSMDQMQLYLSRTGIFSNINMQVIPVLDTIAPSGDRFLDIDIACFLDKPIELKLELQGTSKSNSYLGPGMSVGISHKNLLGGGEQLSAKLNANYEWQTGRGGSYGKSGLNSYEFGAQVDLAFPRLLAPRFVDRSRRYLNWTRFSISGNILNRPKFFKMVKTSAEMKWEWHANRHSLNEFTPLKLTYNKLLSTTEEFVDKVLNNTAILLSFADVFIPEMNYTYTYDNAWGPDNFTWTSTVKEGGNIFSGLWGLAGKKNGEKELFGTPFSQFIKVQTQAVWRHSFTPQSALVGRVMLGAIHAYGNSEYPPYSEEFYIGGANSLRGFMVRSVGPGSYTSPFEGVDAYYDQTGTFKFETNWEYRFPIIGYFKGAAFVDAGNVWLLKKDEWREGGTIGNFFKELALDAGVGLRFDMDMLVVRADLGIALHAPYDTGKNGYFNIPKFKDALAFHLAIGYPF